jgi:AcrR family transcriptional regulator
MGVVPSTPAARPLDGDKARRIVAAMRASVAERGAAASTFDHVAREAGVSRGLLHYYFGTKERLLAEVVRHDGDVRLALLDDALAPARSADDVIDALVRSLGDMVKHDPAFLAGLFELFTVARRNPDIAAELAELTRRTRDRLAGVLAAKEREGVLRLGAAPESVAAVLLALGDGFALRMLSEPETDPGAAIAAGVVAARALLRPA